MDATEGATVEVPDVETGEVDLKTEAEVAQSIEQDIKESEEQIY